MMRLRFTFIRCVIAALLLANLRGDDEQDRGIRRQPLHAAPGPVAYHLAHSL